MDAQLQQIIELQTKQNQLLERYLWRFRFSLLTLLVLTTGICICLGVMIYSKPAATSIFPAPAGTWSTSVIMPTNNAQTPIQLNFDKAIKTFEKATKNIDSHGDIERDVEKYDPKKG